MRFIVLCEGREGSNRHYGVHSGDKPEDAVQEYVGTISPLPPSAVLTAIEYPKAGEAGKVYTFDANLSFARRA